MPSIQPPFSGKEPDYSSVPILVPTPLAKKIYQAFTKSSPKAPEQTQTTETKRSILVQKGMTARAVDLFMKVILGKKLHGELKSQLRKPFIESLADKMKKSSVEESHLEGFSSDEISQAHVHAFPPKDTEQIPLSSGDGKEWHALRFEKGCLFENRVCTTSERRLKTSSDLTNIYVKISDTGHISITCGVIDSKEKADAFIAAVRWAQKKRGPSSKPLRISMHQLNSMGVGPGVLVAEKALVTRQHQLVGYINQQLSPGGPPVVSHTNRCLNGFTQIRGEDAKSHSLNQEGLAQQMQWVYDDIQPSLPNQNQDPSASYIAAQMDVHLTLKNLHQKHTAIMEAENQHPECKKELDYIDQQISEIILNDLFGLGPQTQEAKQNYDSLMRQKASLEGQIAEIKTVKNEIHVLEKKLEKQNKALCRAMHEASKTLSPGDEKTKLELATRILSSQTGMNKELGFEPLSAVQELALMLLLDQALGTVTEINCKSGLDRTGFTRALHTVLQMKVSKDGLDETVEFIRDFEKNVQALDRGVLRDPEKSAVIDFQQNLLTELKKVSIPITERSSGLKGLKLHWTVKSFNPFQKNPHPVNWLPFEGLGKRRISDTLANLLCGLSAKRSG